MPDDEWVEYPWEWEEEWSGNEIRLESREEGGHNQATWLDLAWIGVDEQDYLHM